MTEPRWYRSEKIWDLVLLLIRMWLGYRMITASFSSVTAILFHPAERAFFQQWFGDELHFPMPVTMAFLAKGAELTGGVLLLPGIFSRIAATLIAFTMLVATVTANLGKDFVIDGGFTISYFLFAVMLIVQGAGKYSLDYLAFNGKILKSTARLNPLKRIS